jgi:CheY-like chemotaxis protein
MKKPCITAPFLIENYALMEAVKQCGTSQGYDVCFIQDIQGFPGPNDELPNVLLLEPSVFHWEWLQTLLRFVAQYAHVPIILFATHATAEEGLQRIEGGETIWLANELPMLRRLLRDIKNGFGRSLKTILFVDDDEGMLNAYGRMLRKSPWNLIKSGSGENALKIIESTPIDLVVTDIKMPGIHGMELISKIRGRDKHVPIVVSSGYPGMKEDIDLKYHGIEAFLTKPIEESRLYAELKRILNDQPNALQRP